MRREVGQHDHQRAHRAQPRSFHAALSRRPSSLRRQRGIALIAALALMAVGSAVMMLLFMRTMDELRHGRDDAGIVQTLLVAHGGANLGVALLRGDIQDELNTIVGQQADVVGAWSFGSSGVNDAMPSAASVVSDLRSVANALQSRIDALVCGQRQLEDGAVLNLRIHVTDRACGEPLPPGTRLGDPYFVQGNRREHGGNQTYALPFVMVSDGQLGEFRRRIVTQGAYHFDVGPRSFARYALFTDRHLAGGGNNSRIWFTSDTLFDGPVHTNGSFAFYGQAWFGGPVSSAGITGQGHQGAYAYDGGAGQFMSVGTLEPGGNFPNMDVCTERNRNGTCRTGYENRPQFTGGVDWRSQYIPLPDNAFNQRQLAQANGIFVSQEVRKVEMYAAGANGDPINADQNAAYQYLKVERRSGAGWQTDEYRIASNGRLERRRAGEPGWSLLTTSFNGVVYFEDYVERLTGPGRTNANDPATARPALASFAQLTIVPAQGARITGDIVYQDQPCEGSLRRDGGNVVRPTCENLEARNVLGIFAPQGDIMIGHNNNAPAENAPNNVRIQASLMTSNGVVMVEDYDKGSPRGAVQLLGGIIEERYGAFGQFSSATGQMTTGYSRQFTFDPRLDKGLTPPYFPLVAFDGVLNTYTFTYGHREQVF